MLHDLVAQLQRADVMGDNVEVPASRFTLPQLATELSECRSLPQRHVIKSLSFCLGQNERIERVSEDAVAAAQIATYAAELLRCSQGVLPHTLVDDTASTEEILAVMRAIVIDFSVPIDDDTLLPVVAYTDGDAAWSTETAASAAKDLLDHALGENQRKNFYITSIVLEGFIQPIFSRSSSCRLTSTGRKPHFVHDVQHLAGQDILASGVETMPWKSSQLHAITVFAWAVEKSDEDLIGKNWPLFIPVLLALIDDVATKFKAKGLAILNAFLARCPARVLKDTGLGEIFEQSIFPSFMSLPTLTSEEESLQLLDPAYGAAIQLANAQFPDKKSTHQRNRLFTRLLREGILGGYWYASEYPRIVELLSRQTSLVVRQLGIFTIPHVKQLLSMFASVMTDPFFVSCPACIQATSQALSTVMLNCWPRILQPAHSTEVLRAVCICWLNLDDEQRRNSNTAVLQKALATVCSLVPILSTIFTSAGLSLQEQISPLCDTEPRLVELFSNEKAAPSVLGGE